MSDDKNTDDFSWLRGGDDPQGDDQPADDDAFDWDDLDAGAEPGLPDDDSLGFTGDLAWRGGQSDADASAGDAPGFGFTGDLPWMRRHTPDDEPDAADASGDDLNWLRGTEDDLLTGKIEPPDTAQEPDAGAAQPRPRINLPDWLEDSDPFGPEDADAAPAEPEASWEPSVAAEPEDAGLPAWLLDDDEAPAAETPAPADLSLVDDTGALSKDWLKTGELLPDTTTSELTFDEWAAQQAEAERVPDIEEHLPEFGFEQAGPPDKHPDEPGTGDLPDWFLGLDEFDTSAAPDWFTGAAPLPAEPAPPSAADHDLDEGFFDADAGPEFDLDTLFDTAGAGTADWFTDEQGQPAPAKQPGWLDDLGAPETSAFQASGATETDLPALERADLSFLDSAPAAAADDDDIDSMLAALDSDQLAASADIDFDDLLDEPPGAFSREPKGAPLAADAPDWLAEMGATVGGVSAAALVRQSGEDRPLTDLPDRLRRLRARGENVLAQPAAADPGALAELLPGVGELLPPAPAAAASPSLMTGLLLTPDQRRRADLLRALAGPADSGAGAAAPPIGAGFLADEDDFPHDIEYQGASAPDAALTAAPAARQGRLKPARLLIALLVGAAVILPFFVPALRVGELPPAEFAAGSGGRAVFDTLDQLRPGELALIGVEYGPTAAGELDDLTAVLLRHILARRARPVVVGTNPVGVLRADLILRDLGRADSPFLAEIEHSAPLRPNADYYVLRYLPAASVGLRALGLNTAALLGTDVRGQPTGLDGTALADFAAVVLIGERPEDMRAWAEQIAPLTDLPLLAASGFSAAPLLEPYVGPAFAGLLVGFPDAYTYAAMLAAPGARQPLPELTEEPPVSAPEITEEPPTPTAAPTTTPTTTPALPAAVIFSTQPVNVRQGPGATFAVIASAEPNTEVAVLAQSGDGLWTQIRLPSGVEGWVSASLLRQQPADGGAPILTPLPSDTPAPTLTPLPSDTPVATPTPEPSATPAPTSTGTSVPTSTAAPTDTPRPSATAAPPTATPAPPQVTAIVIASQGVNVRSGPGTTFQPIGSLPTGAQVAVIGRSGDAGWIQVRLDDGREGWISAPLLQINAPAGSSSAPRDIVVVMADADVGRLLRQGAPPAPAAIPYAEERWYGMNLGLLVIVLIILVGAVLNTVRSILRRRR